MKFFAPLLALGLSLPAVSAKNYPPALPLAGRCTPERADQLKCNFYNTLDRMAVGKCMYQGHKWVWVPVEICEPFVTCKLDDVQRFDG
jgi:hypothetical protein